MLAEAGLRAPAWVAHGFSRGGRESGVHSHPPLLKRWATRTRWATRKLPVAAVVLLVLALTHAASAEVTVPFPKSYVTDLANIIEPGTQQRLELWLAELNQKVKAFVVVLTVPTTGGEPFFDFVQRHAETWNKRASGTGVGAIICVAVKERQVRIHTSYGLEHILPDSWCGSVSRNKIAAYFKRGDPNRGMYEGTVAVANKIADAKKITLTGIPNIRHSGQYRQQGSGRARGLACGGLMPMLILFMVIGGAFGRNRRYGAWRGGGLLQGMLLGSILGSTMGGGRSSWGGGGGFGGGGFGGGFGGFGGGGFGGGGFGGGGGGAGW